MEQYLVKQKFDELEVSRGKETEDNILNLATKLTEVDLVKWALFLVMMKMT